MQKTLKTLEQYAPSVLRIGLALVVLWFSLQQFMDGAAWVAYVPDSVVSLSGMKAETLVLGNAIFEAVFGLMLLFGLWTRLSAFLMSLHLFGIMFSLGYGEIAVRDFGLGIGYFAVFMQGPDVWCLDKKKSETITTS
ncbi:MAG: DoxX family protein [Candidatus Pacebacteria bacterium]|nr:DoxX family protein [Candidatus Paceibacterota bacterium]